MTPTGPTGGGWANCGLADPGGQWPEELSPGTHGRLGRIGGGWLAGEWPAPGPERPVAGRAFTQTGARPAGCQVMVEEGPTPPVMTHSGPQVPGRVGDITDPHDPAV